MILDNSKGAKMKIQSIIHLCLGVLFTLSLSTIDAAWTEKDRGLLQMDKAPSFPADEHYQLATEAFNRKNWEVAVRQFSIIATNFPATTFGLDANFYMGVSYYHLCEFDLANYEFDKYLQCQTNPRYFQEAIEYKYCIAEQFRSGAKRHYFGTKQMPKWASGTGLALDIYDEVIAAMPSHDIAAQALSGRGYLLWKQKDYRESIEAFQCLIRRFPKHELAPESYLVINRIYLDQCQREFQNPDLLAFAEINLEKFENQFPGEERIEQAHADVLRIKEVYARGLFDTAQFYERVRQPKAAVIYYQKAIIDFPETTVSTRCISRLSRLCPSALEIAPKEVNDMQIPDNIEFTGILEKEEEVPA